MANRAKRGLGKPILATYAKHPKRFAKPLCYIGATIQLEIPCVDATGRLYDAAIPQFLACPGIRRNAAMPAVSRAGSFQLAELPSRTGYGKGRKRRLSRAL